MHSQERGDPFLGIEGQDVDERPPARGTTRGRNLEHAQPVHLAEIAEAQNGVVRVRDHQVLNEVFVLDAGCRLATPAAALRAVRIDRLGLGVTVVRDRHDHVLLGNQVFHREVFFGAHDLRAALVAVLVTDLDEFVPDDAHEAIGTREDVEQIRDVVDDPAVFLEQAFLLQRGQTIETHFENRLCLLGRKVVLAGVVQAVAWIEILGLRGITSRAREHLFERRGPPGLRNQLLPGLLGVRGGADHLDHFIDVGQGNGHPFEDVTSCPRAAEQVHASPRHDLAAVLNERFEHLLEIQRLGFVVDERNDVDAERGLELGLGVEVVEDHLPHLAASQFDHDAGVRSGLVAQLGNPVDALFLDEFRDPLDEPGAIQEKRNLLDNDRGAACFLIGLDVATSAHDRPAAPRAVCLHDAANAVDDRARGEVRTLDVLHQAVDVDLRILDEGETAVDHFGEIVRRNVGRHPHRNAGRAIHQQIRELRRQHVRHLQRDVVVVDEVDGFLVDVREQFVRDFFHAHFGVTLRRRVVAVDRTEVALAVNKRIPHGPGLRHPHDGLVRRAVAMRVVLADDVTHNPRGFHRRTVPGVVQVVHRPERPAVYRLQTITDIRQRTPDDHAHRVVDEALLELVLDIDRADVAVVYVVVVGFGHLYSGIASLPPRTDRTGKCTLSA